MPRVSPARANSRPISSISPRRSAQSSLGYGIVALLTLNLLIVGANVGWDELRYVRANRAILQELSVAPQPVNVYLGPFQSLRQRLGEAGIQFRIVDAPPREPVVRHPLQGPGHQAFWFN